MKLRTLLLVASTALSLLSLPAAASTLAEDAAAFGARPAVVAPDLSRDGTSIMYLTPGPGHRIFAVEGDLGSGQFKPFVSSDGEKESLYWCRFGSSSRAICNFGAFVKGTEVNLVGFSRLVAMDLNGANMKLLGQSESFYDEWIRQEDGEIIDWLPNSNGNVLVNRLYVPEAGRTGSKIAREKAGWEVDKLDVTTLRADPVEPPRDAAGYLTDGLGDVRIMSITDTDSVGQLTGKATYFYRAKGSRDWQPLAKSVDGDFEPLAIDNSIDSVYALKKKDGRKALYAIRLSGSLPETVIAENPRVDIDDVVRFGKGQKVIGYTYAEDKRTAVYFDPDFKALAASLSKALPKSPIIDFDDASADGKTLLIFAGSDSDPGQYYLFDREHKTLNPAMLVRPELQNHPLASVKPVTISAPDGVGIPAYLTLPPGKEAHGLPAVVLPHGGPSARDEWGFDWLAQFLAARGFAVLQPEFRGSAGFGDAWLNDNGFKNWRTSIGDINASAKWLISEGIADKGHIAIVGWSYGGYAALQSAIVEPGLYKAIVAIAPVTDLTMLKEGAQNFVNADLVAREVGSGPHVIEGSPLRHVAAVSAPVLLVHGTKDSNVDYAQSQRMNAALQAAGKQSELLTFDGLDHQLNDSTARAQMLTKIGQLLDQTIGK